MMVARHVRDVTELGLQEQVHVLAGDLDLAGAMADVVSMCLERSLS
jgi:hypothetical protein